MMKVSDLIVEFFIQKGISDVFGYPGGMVTHLMDSLEKYSNKIRAHVTYHEQAAAFAACGYAMVSGKPGVAYATSGPGATNLITGICNAYFDSIPTIFITGQVNAFELKGAYGVRQRGFQETDIVSMVKNVTKYAVCVTEPAEIPFHLEKAYQCAMSDRTGPVLLDIPMNVLRSEVALCDKCSVSGEVREPVGNDVIAQVQCCLDAAKRPCLLIGNGVKLSRLQGELLEIVEKLGIPVVTSMIAFDVLWNSDRNFGFIGAYGTRVANFIVAKSDLVIAVGSRLDIRQVGARRENFAPNAKIIRFDVDAGELSYHTHDESCFAMGMGNTLELLSKLQCRHDYAAWLSVCRQMQKELSGIDDRLPNKVVSRISEWIPENTVITTDVGQNQVWVAQSFKLKQDQKVLFSGGHGAMGFSLPAAIGACHAAGKKPTICFVGDGGFQMNIQELQYIVRECLPIKIIVLNNTALGMIRHFQEMYFEGNYCQTKPEGGYTVPDFSRIAEAYGIRSARVNAKCDFSLGNALVDGEPFLLEVLFDEDTYVFPKLEFGKPNQDQEPLLDRVLFDRIMAMSEEN